MFGDCVVSQGPLFRFFDLYLDMNKPGLTRGNKGTLKKVGRRMVKCFQNEDTYSISYPFMGQKERGLFVIADGHGGKDAAIASAELFPIVAAEHFCSQREREKEKEKERGREREKKKGDIFFLEPGEQG